MPITKGSGVAYEETRIAGKRITVCRVNLRTQPLQLFLRDTAGHPFHDFTRLAAWLKRRGKTLTFAMNAGMFHADFSPVGLMVAGGKQFSPINTKNGRGNFFLKPNGVFAVTHTEGYVVESSEYVSLPKQRVVLATQSGPLLVRNGKIHPAFNAGSESRLLRNGVGMSSSETAVFAISNDPVNFHEFATLFRDVLRCPNALFLDGNISSLYSTKLKRNDFRRELGPIIGVTE
jgi:uncharacterized protein YigE (DUF2233 family)